MNKSRRSIFLIIALASLLILAACGGEGGGGAGGGGGGGGAGGGGGGGGGTGGGGAGTADVTVSAEGAELKFVPDRISVKAGQQVNLTFANNGVLPHSFVMESANVALPENSTQGINGGEEVGATFTAPAAGTYEFYCDVPGHKAGGMVGTIEVAP